MIDADCLEGIPHPFAIRDNHERLCAVAKALLAGTRNSTSVPASISLHTANVPPVSVARSRMPLNP